MTSPDELRERVADRLQEKWSYTETQREWLLNAADEAIATMKPELDTLAWLHAESVWQYDQAVKDWGLNDERMLEENQRLANERDALRAQLAALTDPSDAVLDKAAVWLLRAKISRLAQDEPERTARMWQEVFDKGDREGWRTCARLMLADLYATATSKASQEDLPPAAASADTTPRVWRDVRGCEWEEVSPHGELCLIRTDPSHCREVGGPTFSQRYVKAHYGPLVEVLPNAEQEAEK